MSDDVVLVTGSWKFPERIVLEGKYCSLEPLTQKHADHLYDLCNCPDAPTRYQYLLGYMPPSERSLFNKWIETMASSKDPIVFVVIDKSTGKVEGKQHLMRIESNFGVIEIGAILYGPNISRSRISTEAFYLMARYVFDDLKYRRFEWKCNDSNVASKSAALRFGYTFEGTFRQHMIDAKGQNRDTAWYSMLDKEWPAIKKSFQRWLEPSNFDEYGKQKATLQSFRNM